MIIAGKSKIDKGQLQERVNKGAEYLELHLDSVDVEDNKAINKSLEILKPFKDMVIVVHTPINFKYAIECISTDKGFNMISNTSRLAQKIAEETSRTVHQVIHMELGYNHIKELELDQIITERIGLLLEKNNNITLNLENSSAINLENDEFVFRPNHFDKCVKYCEKLRNTLSTDRIGLVLDICHALNTIRIYDALNKIAVSKKIQLETFLNVYLPYLNVIHLANASGLGFEKGHGVPFKSVDDVEILIKIIKKLKEEKYNKVVTIEMLEEDYLNIKNMNFTMRQLKNLSECSELN